MKKEDKKYYIKQYSQQEYRHGGIGYADAETILANEGYEAIDFPGYNEFSLLSKCRRIFYLIRISFTVRKGSVIVFLFPVYATIIKLLLRLLLRKKCRIICFIGDINGLKDGDPEELQRELIFFRQFNHFIAHNEHMRQWIEEQVPGCHTSGIEFFDFLAIPSTIDHYLSPEVVFAGNLEKSRFLEDLHLLKAIDPLLHFNLYGPGQTQLMLDQENVSWYGIEDPHVLPSKLKGSFGLLWDGDAIDKPAGSLGDYMQYISHHKLSLYILAKLPLIVPASAASAYLVEKYKIGFCIHNLSEIGRKIKTLSEADYKHMQDNMDKLARKISAGEELKEALKVLNFKF